MNINRISDGLRTHQGTFVQLRPIQPSDAGVTLGWRLGKRAALLHVGAASVERQSAWISNRPNNELNFIIETFPRKIPVGMLSLIDINLASKRAEPARFLIGEERLARGLPVAAEALSLLYDLAFRTLNLRRLDGTVVKENNSMLKWHLYLGAKETGALPEKDTIDGDLKTLVGITLNYEDYLSIARPKLESLINLGRVRSSRH